MPKCDVCGKRFSKTGTKRERNRLHYRCSPACQKVAFRHYMRDYMRDKRRRDGSMGP